MAWELGLPSPEHTRALGAALGRACAPGAVLALHGGLGAGKTCLAQGVGEGLGVRGPVVSPSFQILAEYPGRLTLYHADLYRLGDEGELEELGLEEALGAGGVMVVEWASRFGGLLPQDHLSVELLPGPGPDARRARLSAGGAASLALLERLRAEVSDAG